MAGKSTHSAVFRDTYALHYIDKIACMIKFMLTLVVFFLRPNAVLENATVLSIQLLRWLQNGDVIWIKVAYVEH